MGHETHIVRFKITALECTSLPNGQQYTISYRRGDTSGSTPCYVARDGVVDFSAMPEGTAIVHFKSGKMGRRYAPKYIQLRVEEYTRGSPRRTVGEVEVDCAEVLRGMESAGSGITAVQFRLYGMPARMKVAVLVYPQHAPPLSFDGIVASTRGSADAAGQPDATRGEVKVMTRGEAMTLLISMETMLERRKAEHGTQSAPTTRVEAKLHELEEKRKRLVATEGLATTVVVTRTDEVVAAQFKALSRKYRNNFVGETAAYFRQAALANGVSLTGNDDANDTTLREQLTRVTKRIDDLQQQIKKLEEDQLALGRIEHKTDVTAEVCANLEKISTVEAQLKILQQSRDALDSALQSRKSAANSPFTRDVNELNERVKTLTGEQEQLRAKIQHMTAVASGHVLSWARAKNPPQPDEPAENIDELFTSSPKSPGGAEDSTPLGDDQRKEILSAFAGMKVSAPPATARSASSSSGHRSPQDLFGATDLPSMGDFGGSSRKTPAAPQPQKPQQQQPAAKPREAPPPPPKVQDPLAPDLGKNMFAADPPPPPAAPAGLPSMSDFMAPPPSAATPATAPAFEFGPTSTSATDAFHADPSPGFTLEMDGPSSSAAADTPFGNAVQVSSPSNPYYDDIDDYTIPEDIARQNAGPASFEYNDFGNFGVGSPNTEAAPTGAAAAPSAPAAAPPRPTFNFGPSDDADSGAGGFGGGGATVSFEGAPTYDFGGGSAEGNTNTTSGFSNLPTYNFGS